LIAHALLLSGRIREFSQAGREYWSLNPKRSDRKVSGIAQWLRRIKQ
jgi:hypothetical protein